MNADGGRGARGGVGDAPDGGAVGEQLVRARLDAVGDVAVGGAAVRGVVLEAAVAGRVVRRRDDDAVGEARVAGGVVRDDRARQRRRRRVLPVGLDPRVDAVRGQHLYRGAQRGRRGGVRVRAQEQRAGDAGARAVIADRLCDRQDVGLVERAVLGGAAVAAGPERDALARVVGVGAAVVVGGDQAVDVDQDLGWRGLSGKRRERHGRKAMLDGAIGEGGRRWIVLSVAGHLASAAHEKLRIHLPGPGAGSRVRDDKRPEPGPRPRRRGSPRRGGDLRRAAAVDAVALPGGRRRRRLDVRRRGRSAACR